MFARFVMDTDYLTGDPTETVMAARWRLQTSPHRTIYVTDAHQRLMGVVRESAVREWNSPGHLRDIMETPDASGQIGPDVDITEVLPKFAEHPDWYSVPVVSDTGQMLGVVARDMGQTARQPADNYARAQATGQLARAVWDALKSGFLIIDAHGIVRQLNPFGAEMLGVPLDAVIDQPYEELAQYVFAHMRDYLRESLVPDVLGQSTGQGEREFRIQNGRVMQFSYGTVLEEEALVAVVITFVDITALRDAEQKALHKAREAESAFGLALPNTKIEIKLKSSPEYADVFDPTTGVATVTQVIPNGTYWHVINGLRLMAELKAIGVFQLVGMDKDTLVQAFIFHDVGKEQPHLALGQEFVPTDTFESGALHAARSADWAIREYHVSTDVEWIVRYHHTPEAKLPDTFPTALKPMWRLFKLIDGLSAGITRREAEIAPMTLDGTVLTIREHSRDARYNRAYRVSIYTGHEEPLDSD